MIIALDTETTGRDFRHGCRPFFVSICNDDGQQSYWEWDVDPKTRFPDTPESDLDEIQDLINSADQIILQNAKFDVAALTVLFEDFGRQLNWNWDITHDTIVAAHLLNSNELKNLNALSAQYLLYDITKYEKELERICVEARRMAKRKDFKTRFGEWKLSEEDVDELPSANGKQLWRADYWLPMAIAKILHYPSDHPYRHALRNYANVDPTVTLHIWKQQWPEIQRRKLDKIYEWKRQLTRITFDMEQRKVTLNGNRLVELKREFGNESKRLNAVCTHIAEDYNYKLELGSGVNNSLRTFCFDILKLEHVRNPKAKTDAPCLDAKHAIPHYMATLEHNTKERTFIEALVEKRELDAALGYLRSYERFMVDGGIYQSLNHVGTDTLRFSSENPNMQNISKKKDTNTRYCFGPDEGREWWSLDKKNLELRIPAYDSNEESLIQLFEDPDAPPFYGSNHLLNFSVIYPDLWEDAVRKVGIDKAGPYCKKEYESTWYKWCKNGNFAIQYGAVDRPDGTGTADRAFHKPGAHALLKARFSKLEKLNSYWISFADRHGYIETMPDRTVDPERGYPLRCVRGKYGKVKPTIPLSYRVQGTAMWLTCRSMIQCQRQLDEWNRRAGKILYWITLQVHDELVFDFPRMADPFKNPRNSNLGKIRVLQKLMEEGGTAIGVPTPVGVEYNPDNWSVGIAI